MLSSLIKSWWNRQVIPTLPTLQVITHFLLGLFLVVAILFGFKYIFLTDCLAAGNVKACVTSQVNSTDTFIALGTILIAIVALIPTFWIDSKIRDAKKEIIREVTETVQESMQRLNQAQILMFEADRVEDALYLPTRESLIQDAIRLWPFFKGEGDKKLGNDFSEAVIAHFELNLGAITDLIRSYLNKAIFYLEETVRNSAKPDRDTLENLACMYGCADRYDDMIRVIEQAIKADENAKDDFQESKRLSLLMRSCGTGKRKIEKLGKKIGKELPLSKAEFIRIVNSVDLENRPGHYIVFFAISKGQRLTHDYVYLIKIACAVIQGQRLVTSAFYYSEIEDQNIKDILPTPPRPISVEEAFDEFDKVLYIICSPED